MSTMVEVDVDERLLDLAEVDVGRVFLLQNARAARRFDLFGRFRSERSEQVLRRVAIGLCILGSLLALVMVVRGIAVERHFPVRAGALLGALVSLGCVFAAAPRLRLRAVQRLDARLAADARKVLRRARRTQPFRVRYTFEDSTLLAEQRVEDDWSRRFEVTPVDVGYALAGQRTVSLLKSPKSVRPSAVVFAASEDDVGSIARELEAGEYEVEVLSRDLLPQSTVPRAW